MFVILCDSMATKVGSPETTVVRPTKGDVIALCDADDEVAPGSSAAMMRSLNAALCPTRWYISGVAGT